MNEAWLLMMNYMMNSTSIMLSKRFQRQNCSYFRIPFIWKCKTNLQSNNCGEVMVAVWSAWERVGALEMETSWWFGQFSKKRSWARKAMEKLPPAPLGFLPEQNVGAGNRYACWLEVESLYISSNSRLSPLICQSSYELWRSSFVL